MRKIMIILSLVSLLQVFGQLTTIPDQHLREVLEATYPKYFSDHRLIDSMALKHNGFIGCAGRGIVSISGLEKFKNLRYLDLSNNLIADASPLAELSALEDLNLDNNSIVQLPSFEKLTQLTYLYCSKNRLKSLPDFKYHPKLKKLQCYNNEILEIKGIENLVSLEYIIAYDNKLKSLPNLSALQNLYYLECHGNQIDTLIGLSFLKNLKILVVGSNLFKKLNNLQGLDNLTLLSCYSNQIAEVPDLSKLPLLEEFDANNNKLQTLPNFSQNYNLKIIKCQDNELRNPLTLANLNSLQHLQLSNNRMEVWPQLQGTEDNLEYLYLKDNLLDTLPDLSSYIALDTLGLEGNHLTFEDLEPLMALPIKIGYTPQRNIIVQNLVQIKSGESWTWDLGIDQRTSNNTYTWYKDGKYVATTNTGIFKRAEVSYDDQGMYTCEITNRLVPGLVLKTTSLNLVVPTCIDLRFLKYTTTEITCAKAGSIVIDGNSIISDNRNFEYILKNTSGLVVPQQGLGFENLEESLYKLTVKNTAGCSASKNIEVPRSLENCSKGIILATGEDPSLQGFYISHTGTASVYNKAGTLVKKLTAPTFWDGKQEDGNILPGLYVIEINGLYIDVTVIK